MKPLRSKRYLAASRDQTCKFQIPGVCLGGTETVVPCHLRDDHAGGAQKASDSSVADGCFACHAVMDRRAKMPDGFLITNEEWNYYALRGLQRTIEARIVAGVLVWPADIERPPKANSVAAKRKGPKLRGRPMAKSGAKIQSRKFQRQK